MLSNLIPRVPCFYIRTKSRLKNRVTTVPLLQYKTDFFIRQCFLHSSTQIKGHPFWEASINMNSFFLIRLHLSTFVYTRLNSSRVVYNCLDSSSDSLHSSTFVQTCLVTRLHSSTFVYIRLDWSSDSTVFLEQILQKWGYLFCSKSMSKAIREVNSIIYLITASMENKLKM